MSNLHGEFVMYRAYVKLALTVHMSTPAVYAL